MPCSGWPASSSGLAASHASHGDGATADGGVANEYDRPRRSVHLLATELEGGVPSDDEVELLVAACAGPELVVLLDHASIRLGGGVGIDAEGADAEMEPDGRNGERGRALDLRDVLEARDRVGPVAQPRRRPRLPRARAGRAERYLRRSRRRWQTRRRASPLPRPRRGRRSRRP